MSPIRLFIYRHRVLFASLYVCGILVVGAALWTYYALVPGSLDQGVTVGLRSLAHRLTFTAVEAAQRDIDAARATTDPAERDQLERRAIRLLDRYLESRHSVQPHRLHTQAVVASTELLSEIHTSRGRLGRAEKVLDRLIDHIPHNYRLHWQHAVALEESGDGKKALDAYRAAFKLAPNHAELTESYLAALGEVNGFEDIDWVAKTFDHAVRAGAPSVEIKAGSPRSDVQQQVLDFTGIPIEHGSYQRSVHLFGLDRGEGCTLRIPADFFDRWNHGSPLYLQLRFENVYTDLNVTALRWWDENDQQHDVDLTASGRMAVLHRPHSGVESYIELRTELDPQQIARIEIDYSCPVQALSPTALAIIDRARVNLGLPQ